MGGVPLGENLNRIACILATRAAAILSRQVEGQAKPQVVARFTINAVPALAVLERNRPKDRDDAPVSAWGSIHSSPGTKPATVGGHPEAVVPLTYDRREAARRLRKTQPKS